MICITTIESLCGLVSVPKQMPSHFCESIKKYYKDYRQYLPQLKDAYKERDNLIGWRMSIFTDAIKSAFWATLIPTAVWAFYHIRTEDLALEQTVFLNSRLKKAIVISIYVFIFTDIFLLHRYNRGSDYDRYLKIKNEKEMEPYKAIDNDRLDDYFAKGGKAKKIF